MLGRRRRPAPPEESAGLRAAVAVAMVIAAASVGIVGGNILAAGLCIAVGVAGHHWSWRRRHGGRRRAQALVGLGLIGATALLLAEVFLGVGDDSFPQGTYVLLLLGVTSFDVRSRANCYSSLLLGVAGVYAAASLAYDDTMLLAIVAFSTAGLAALALAYREDARQVGSRRPSPPAPRGETSRPDAGEEDAGVSARTADQGRQQDRYEVIAGATAGGGAGPARGHAGSLGAMGALAAAVLAGGIGAFVLVPPYEGDLPAYPVSPDFTVKASYKGAVLNPLLPVVTASSPTNAGAPRTGYYGFAPELQLGAYGRLDDTALMRVHSTGWSYWRMRTYDTYTGNSWRATSGPLDALERGSDGAVVTGDDSAGRPAGASPGGGAIRQTFTMIKDGTNLIPVGYRPVRVYFPEPTLWQRRGDGDLSADQPLHAGATYAVVSRLPQSDPAVLRADHGADPPDLTATLALPALPDSVVAAAHGATTGARTRYDRVTAIFAYVQARARYDLSTPALAPGQEAVSTLLATGRGYCEQFATALTVMAHLNGIPARLVTGFAPGRYDAFSRAYTVRASDAHAWTEIYFPGYGWLPFDATPSYDG